MSRQPTLTNESFDPGAKLCGHGDRSQRVHYLGGGLWVCLECLAKMFTGKSLTRTDTTQEDSDG